MEQIGDYKRGLARHLSAIHVEGWGRASLMVEEALLLDESAGVDANTAPEDGLGHCGPAPPHKARVPWPP